MAEEKESKCDDDMNMMVEPSFPSGRVKRIMKLDKEINKINSEALFLISSSLDLFIQTLAHKAALVALEKKRKTLNLDHLRIAVKRHQPTRDFLLDSLPKPAQTERTRSHSNNDDKPPLPAGTRRIDHFFHKDNN